MQFVARRVAVAGAEIVLGVLGVSAIIALFVALGELERRRKRDAQRRDEPDS